MWSIFTYRGVFVNFASVMFYIDLFLHVSVPRPTKDYKASESYLKIIKSWCLIIISVNMQPSQLNNNIYNYIKCCSTRADESSTNLRKRSLVVVFFL